MTLTMSALGLPLALLLTAVPHSPRPAAVICPATDAARTPDAAPQPVRLHVYNQSLMTPADVDAVLDVARHIWAPYGVTLELDSSEGAVTVILSERLMLPGTFGRANVLGTTLFSDGHATPYISVSRAAAEAFANDTDDSGRPFARLPHARQETILIRMLGIALAHEMGHYLLDTAQHSSHGLMKPGLRPHDLIETDPSLLTLSPELRRRLCPVTAAAVR